MQGIGASIAATNTAAAAPTTGVLAPAADSVSARNAALLSAHAQHYQALSARAEAFHQQFVQTLIAGENSYAETEASNAAAMDPPVFPPGVVILLSAGAGASLIGAGAALSTGIALPLALAVPLGLAAVNSPSASGPASPVTVPGPNSPTPGPTPPQPRARPAPTTPQPAARPAPTTPQPGARPWWVGGPGGGGITHDGGIAGALSGW